LDYLRRRRRGAHGLPGEIAQRLVVETVYAAQDLVLPGQAGAENQRIVRA